jgi:hypothetical protein
VLLDAAVWLMLLKGQSRYLFLAQYSIKSKKILNKKVLWKQ